MDDDIWRMFDKAVQIREEETAVSNNEIKNDISNHIKTQKQRTDVCSGCGEMMVTNQSVTDGFIACDNCGLVKESYIDTNAEWRCFNTASGGKDLSGVRCGDPASSLLPGTQLNTFVGGKDKRLQRVHQWNNLTPRERNMHQIYKEFDAIGQKHKLSKNVTSAATELYNRLYTEMENKNCGVKRCNVRQGFKAACLYFACKQMNTPRERKEIAEMMGTTTRIVTKGYNSFLDIMGGDFIKMDPFKPEDFVERFSSLLSLPYPMQRKLENVVAYAASLEHLADNTPTSVTSACIYFLSCEYDLGITKEMIHKACGSSQIIISKTYTKLVPYLEEMRARL